MRTGIDRNGVLQRILHEFGRRREGELLCRYARVRETLLHHGRRVVLVEGGLRCRERLLVLHLHLNLPARAASTRTVAPATAVRVGLLQVRQEALLLALVQLPRIELSKARLERTAGRAEPGASVRAAGRPELWQEPTVRLRGAFERARAADTGRPVKVRLRCWRAGDRRAFARWYRSRLECVAGRIAYWFRLTRCRQHREGRRILRFFRRGNKESSRRLELLNAVAHLKSRDCFDLVVLAERRGRNHAG